MALPNSIDAATPGGTDSPALGDDQFRALKTFIEDIFGIPDATSITAAAFSISSAGVVTVSQANTRMTSIELGHASDTTITRASAGVIAVEGVNVALVSNNLSVFAATTSAQLAGVISDETGSGALVFGTSPAFTTQISTPSIVTASGALTITPAAGSNLNVALSTTGDFAVNTDDLYVDTSTGNVGIGTATPSEQFNTTGTFRFDSTGPHAIGGASFGDTVLRFTGTFTPSTGLAAYNIDVATALVPSVGTEAVGVFIEPPITEAASGTHPHFNSLRVQPPIITAGGAAVTVASTVDITGAPTAGVSNYALRVIAGHTLLGGTVNIAGLVAMGSSTLTPDGTLHVHTATAGTVTADANADDLVVENSGAGGISILTPSTSDGNIYLGNQAENGTARITREATTGDLKFTFQTGAGIFRFQQDGNLGIGISASLLAKTHVKQESTTGAIPVLALEQSDVSEQMIDFITTIGTGNAIEAIGAKTLTTTHFIKVRIPGSLDRYIPVGTIA